MVCPETEITTTESKSDKKLSLQKKGRILFNQLFGHPIRAAILGGWFISAQGLAKDPTELRQFINAALMHDIGKFGVPNGGWKLIFKVDTDKPSKAERKRFQIHPILSRKFLKWLGLEKIAEIVLYHHEKWNRKDGYPLGLSGEQIPYLSRILKIVDAFDAMISWRAYNKVLSVNDAVKKLQNNAGKNFDPELVEIFCEFVKNNHEIIESFASKLNFENLFKNRRKLIRACFC